MLIAKNTVCPVTWAVKRERIVVLISKQFLDPGQIEGNDVVLCAIVG